MAYTTIKDSSQFFHTQLYTSNNGYAVSVVNDANFGDFKPDILWVKSRYTIGGYDYDHNLIDSSRGKTKTLWPNANNTEFTASQSNYDLTSFDTDGFTNGAPESTNSLGGGNLGKVAWQWKINGGTTSTDTNGDIDTTVQVNQTAGQSIVLYSPSNNTARTIGHGLGAVPKFIIIRARTRVENWHVFHYSAGTGGITLDTGNAYNNNTVLGDALPTSTVYKLGTDFRMNGNYSYVGYFFTDVQGYSKFDKYTGNGNANGPFVYTGFKPALLLIKEKDGTEPWVMYDTARNPFNVTDLKLSPQHINAENDISALGAAQYNTVDILSNGFKLRSNNGATNGSGNTFVYAAWAESPFVAGGVPTTAR